MAKISAGQAALALNTLGAAFLAGQPNAQTSAAYNMNRAGAEQVQGTLMQEAKKKAEKKAKKKKKKAKLKQVGSLVGGLALAPFTGGMSLAGAGATMGAGATIGGALASGDFDIKDAAINIGGGAAMGALGSAAGMSNTGQQAVKSFGDHTNAFSQAIVKDATKQQAMQNIQNFALGGMQNPVTSSFGTSQNLVAKREQRLVFNPLTNQMEYR